MANKAINILANIIIEIITNKIPKEIYLLFYNISEWIILEIGKRILQPMLVLNL